MCSIASHITTNIPFACYQLYAFGFLGAASPAERRAEGRFGLQVRPNVRPGERRPERPPRSGPVTRHLFPSFFNCTPAETDVGTRLAGPARCGDLFVRARRAGCHRSGRATAAVRWPRCASLLRYARFARRILCPAGFLVALVFSRSKNASSNSSLVYQQLIV